MHTLSLAFLGSPKIILNGNPVQTDRRKAIALLAYLAVTGKPHTRDHLAALLWPDYERDSAYAYLRRTLWEVNQILGKGWIDADRERVALAQTPDRWLDTTAFQEVIRAGSSDIDTLAEAVELYRGDFLAGFSVADTAPFEDWQFQQAEYFRRAFARALEQLVEIQHQTGEYEPALSPARRWLALDPINEAAHRAIMRLLAGMGDRTGAIRQYETCVQTLQDELGIPPQPETTELYETILQGDITKPSEPTTQHIPTGPRTITRLPAMPSPFIGRRPEVEQVKALVQNPAHRLITLTGPGGTGKTRLVIQAASEMNHAFLDGVYFASLAPVQTAESVLPALAKTLDFSFYREEETPRQQLLDFLREKRLLLILDNFEHVLEATELVNDILVNAPDVKLVATSRVRLNLPGEQIYPVSGMRTPNVAEAESWDDPDTQAKPFSAVQLFLDRARRVQPDFGLTKDNISAVLEICRLVQGMPLALELAAAWIELLSPEEIAIEISHSLDFLETDHAGVPDRQRSIRAVFESSWKLLSQDEREVFLGLCVFVGSFSREAAQQVSGASLRTLLRLANKSWLQQTGGGRFQLHELMRQYGEERLKADEPTWRGFKHNHATYFASFFADQSLRLRGPEQLDCLKMLDEEFGGNIKAAWDWLVEERVWETILEKMALGLFHYGSIRDLMADLIFWFRSARIKLAAHPDSANLFSWAILGTLEIFAEETEEIKDANPIERLVALWQLVKEHQLEEAMGFWYVLLVGMVAARNIDEKASQQVESALKQIRRKNDPWLLGMSLLVGDNIWNEFQFDENKLEEAGQMFQQLGVLFEQGIVANLQGRHAVQLKRPIAEVTHHFQRAQSFFEKLGDPNSNTYNAILLGQMFIQQGQVKELFEQFHREQQILERLGNVRLLGASLQWEALYASRYGSLEHALAVRQRSLAVASKANVQSDALWQNLEIGEIYRLMGDLERAQEYYQQTRSGFEKTHMVLGLGFYERGQGDLALADRRYTEALAHYQTFLEFVRQDNHAWSMVQAHAKLGLAHAYLENREQARNEMFEALTDLQGLGMDELGLLALLVEMVCLVQEDQPEQAMELGAFVIHHPVSWNETKQQARAILETASSKLPDEVVQAAVEKGKGLELEVMIKKVLGERRPTV